MSNDAGNKVIIKGAIWLFVIAVSLYYLPGYGYQTQVVAEETTLTKLKDTKNEWDKHYPVMHSSYLGIPSQDETAPPEGRLRSEIQHEYTIDNETTQLRIADLEGISKINFPKWTDIPEEDKREPGVYFVKTYRHKRIELGNIWRQKGVECKDETIGFEELAGTVVRADENKSRELLRELYIAESIIKLCIDAKERQKNDDIKRSIQTEAYMKILSVRPEASVPSGPYALIPNPKYNPKETNPTSPNFRKNNVRSWDAFIQEYPVELLIQCDYNSFQRFLHSVRSPGQFLVIRSLEILSPFANDSKLDSTELKSILNKVNADGSKNELPKDEQILVKISASGMDFFDPKEFPDGLYKPAKDTTKSVKRRRMVGEQ